jgi:hypothetical protein
MVEQMKKNGQWYTTVSDERLEDLTLKFRNKYGNLPQEQDDDIGGLKRLQQEQLSPTNKKNRPSNPTPSEAETIAPSTVKENIQKARTGNSIVIKINKLMNDNNFNKKAIQQQLVMRGIEFNIEDTKDQLKKLINDLVQQNPTIFQNELEEEAIFKNILTYTRGGKRPLPIATAKWKERISRHMAR